VAYELVTDTQICLYLLLSYSFLSSAAPWNCYEFLYCYEENKLVEFLLSAVKNLVKDSSAGSTNLQYSVSRSGVFLFKINDNVALKTCNGIVTATVPISLLSP